MWGDHWPRPVRGGGSQPIRAQQQCRLTNQRPLPDLGDKEQPHLVLTRARHSSGLPSDLQNQIKSEGTWHGVWCMMLSETCEGSLNAWSALTWPVARLVAHHPPGVTPLLWLWWVIHDAVSHPSHGPRGEIMELGTCLTELPLIPTLCHVYTGVNWPHTARITHTAAV